MSDGSGKLEKDMRSATSVEEYFTFGDGNVPNSRFPITVYRSIGSDRIQSRTLKECLGQNGWIPDWFSSDGMYPRHHFHSDAHEFIAVLEGEFTCRLGGEHGIDTHLHKGDALVIPAGVAHCGDRKSERLAIMGAFPAGFGIHDFRLGYPSEYTQMAMRAQQVPVPPNDPLFGPKGPLVQRWTQHS